MVRSAAVIARRACHVAKLQPPTEWLAGHFVGAPVKNATGEKLGDINDLLFDRSGKISTVVIGVGGFLGVGEKQVAVPFDALSITTDKEGGRVVDLSVTKEALEQAPEFKPTEKGLLTRASETVKDWGKRATERAGELKERIDQKVDKMKKEQTR